MGWDFFAEKKMRDVVKGDLKFLDKKPLSCNFKYLEKKGK